MYYYVYIIKHIYICNVVIYVYVMIYVMIYIYSISLKPFCKKTSFTPSGKHMSMHAPQIFNSTKKTWFLVVFEISIRAA